MEKWEYMVEDSGDKAKREIMAWKMLNELGREGWELVSVDDDGLLYLKRKAPQ